MACMCCEYPNGAWQVISFQFLLFVGWWLAMAALGDCHFATVTPFGGNLPELDTKPEFGVGFLIFEDLDGDCFYDLDDDLFETYIDDFLGSDWRPARALAATNVLLAVLLFIWSLFFICLPFPKPLRYVIAFLLLVMVILQGCTFIVLSSDFCDDLDCEFGRSAGFSVGALLCFFFCVVFLCLMKDYDDTERSRPVYDTAEDEVQVEKEAPEEEAPAQDATPVEEEAEAVAEEVEISEDVPDEGVGGSLTKSGASASVY